MRLLPRDKVNCEELAVNAFFPYVDPENRYAQVLGLIHAQPIV